MRSLSRLLSHDGRRARVNLLLAGLWFSTPCVQAADVDAYRIEGDYDGDGETEQLRVDSSGAFQVYLSSGRIYRASLSDGRGARIAPGRFQHLVAGDFNGDGCDDLRLLATNPPADFVWGIDAPAPLHEDVLADELGNPLDPATLKYALVGDFNGDGTDELRGLSRTSAMNYVWNLSRTPVYAGLLTNTVDAPVGAAILAYAVVGDFDGDGADELRGLQAGTAWNYVWKLASAPIVSSDLADTAGTPLPVNSLRHVFVGDFDDDGRDELRALLGGSTLNYVWKTNRIATYQGELQNIAGAPVPVDALSSVFTYRLHPGEPPRLAAFHAGVWYYIWGLAPLPLEHGPLTNNNDVADLRFETPWTAPHDARDRPLVVANYFLGFTGVGTEVGLPHAYHPGNLWHQCGAWHNPDTQDYWLAQPGEMGFLTFGPYETQNQIKAAIQTLNNQTYSSLCYRVAFELMITDNTFSTSPIGYLDVMATDTSGTARVLYKHDLFPQDFLEAGVFSQFSYQFADYVPHADERLEFRVFTTGDRALACKQILVFPQRFDSVFGGWGNVPWNGGLELGYAYRIFDPYWLRTSHIGKDGLASPVGSIEPWRRDIVTGHFGFYPYIGPYDQRSTELLRYQIRQAKGAGLDGFKVYIYYSSRATDTDLHSWDWVWQTVEKMLQISDEEGFGIYFDDSMLEQVASTSYTYADAVANLGFAAQRGYLSHPGYLKINGRPLYGMPITNETDPQSMVNFVAQMNQRYQLATSSTTQLYSLVTALTTWSVQNPTGPYNMQELFFYPEYHVWQNWQRYFTCTPEPQSLTDLVRDGRCKYDPTQPVSGYGVFLSTLLERDELAGFRNLPGVTSLFDWCNGGAMLYPQLQLSDGTPFHLTGTPDTTTTLEAFRRYSQDARRYGYGSTITVIPGHDKSNLFSWVDYEMIPRTEADGHTLRFRRMLRSAMATHPDIIDVENWNGYGEAVIIEPCEGFIDDAGNSDPDIYLKLIAETLGQTYQRPLIPPSIVDPIRLPYLPKSRLDQPPESSVVHWEQYR